MELIKLETELASAKSALATLRKHLCIVDGRVYSDERQLTIDEMDSLEGYVKWRASSR